jgi:hypothetical protein
MALIKAAKKGSLEEIEKIVTNDPTLIENEKDKVGYFFHFLIINSI